MAIYTQMWENSDFLYNFDKRASNELVWNIYIMIYTVIGQRMPNLGSTVTSRKSIFM